MVLLYTVLLQFIFNEIVLHQVKFKLATMAHAMSGMMYESVRFFLNEMKWICYMKQYAVVLVSKYKYDECVLYIVRVRACSFVEFI